MSISAANVVPNFLLRGSITAEELRQLQEPVALFEYEGRDSDGRPFFVYTVAGWLNGQNIATAQGGCTVGGQVIVIPMETREEADQMVADGLATTLNALDKDEEDTRDAVKSLERLRSVGEQERFDQAIRPDKNEDFMNDAEAIQKLRGDDIILTAGRVAVPGIKNVFPALH
jgi:hypothetical protein